MTEQNAIDILRCKTDGNAVEALDMAIKALERSTDNEKALSGRLSDRDRIIQLIEGHKGCQTQINLVLSKIIKEIEVLL